MCEAFWMQNLIQKYFGNGDSNCGMSNRSFYPDNIGDIPNHPSNYDLLKGNI